MNDEFLEKNNHISGTQLLLSDVFLSDDEKNENVNVNQVNNLKKRELTQGNPQRPVKENKRKRKTFSCDNCRQLKTKCVSNILGGCERCSRLKIECNLSSTKPYTSSETIEKLGNISETIKSVANESLKNESVRLKNIEDNIIKMNQNIECLVEMQSQTKNLIKNLDKNSVSQNNTGDGIPQSVNYLNNSNHSGIFGVNFNKNVSYERGRQFSNDGSLMSSSDTETPNIGSFVELKAQLPQRKDKSAPLNLIESVETSIFGKNLNGNRSDFIRALDKFTEFYLKNDALCLELSKEFLDFSHYYIIPGGISVIDREYVLEHPMITCVFVLIAMANSKEYKNSEKMHEVEQLLKNILFSINDKYPLSDHDIEAILYICMYNICDIDLWLLSGIGIMHFFISVDLRSIIDRVVDKAIYFDDDLFHLRILNSLCSCHLEYAVGKGRNTLINEILWKVHGLSILFPKATIGDAIQVSKLDFFQNLIKLYLNNDYFIDFQNDKIDEQKVEVKELSKWKHKWKKIIAKDVSKITSYTYHFGYILLSRKYIDTAGNNDSDNASNKLALKTAIAHSFDLLEIFVHTSIEFIKNIPDFQLQEIVYASLTLMEYLSRMNANEKELTISYISKTYWYLNKRGQEMNDLTNTIAIIVKKLVEMAGEDKELQIYSTEVIDKGFIGSGSHTGMGRYRELRVRDTPQQRRLSREDLPLLSSDTTNNTIVNTVPQLPDLENFTSFDDFFKDLFLPQG